MGTNIDTYKDSSGDDFVKFLSTTGVRIEGKIKDLSPSDAITIKVALRQKLYDRRQIDGMRAVNALMSELAVNSELNNLPRAVNKAIENAFGKTKDALMVGWWKTALEEATDVSISAYVTQSLKDRIIKTIQDYIAINYTV